MTAPSLLARPAAVVWACCEDEDWKPIPDWPHEASSCGRIRSIDRLGADGVWRLGAILPQYPDRRKGKGYMYADLTDGKRRRKVHVAVAVLEAHRELKPGPGYEACHSGGNDRQPPGEAALGHERGEPRRHVGGTPGL